MGELTFIDADELIAVPWKNGGGITRESAQRAGPDGFAGRLSLADVDPQCDFSRFPALSARCRQTNQYEN